ncbi:hypothetical protein U1Q18_040500, partial [Sarracenia purpurea var. burkii]
MVIDWLAWYRRSPSTDDLSKELSPSEKKSKGGVAFIQRQVLKDLDLGDIEGKNEVGFCSVEAVAVTSSTVAISEVSDPDSSKNKGSVLKSRDVSVLGNTVLKSYSSSVSKEGFEASQAESEADEEEDEEVRISRSKRKEESDVNPESEKVPVLEDKIIKIEVVDHCEGKGEVLEVGDTASATLPEGASCQVSTKKCQSISAICCCIIWLLRLVMALCAVTAACLRGVLLCSGFDFQSPEEDENEGEAEYEEEQESGDDKVKVSTGIVVAAISYKEAEAIIASEDSEEGSEEESGYEEEDELEEAKKEERPAHPELLADGKNEAKEKIEESGVNSVIEEKILYLGFRVSRSEFRGGRCSVSRAIGQRVGFRVSKLASALRAGIWWMGHIDIRWEFFFTAVLHLGPAVISPRTIFAWAGKCFPASAHVTRAGLLPSVGEAWVLKMVWWTGGGDPR